MAGASLHNLHRCGLRSGGSLRPSSGLETTPCSCAIARSLPKSLKIPAGALNQCKENEGAPQRWSLSFLSSSSFSSTTCHGTRCGHRGPKGTILWGRAAMPSHAPHGASAWLLQALVTGHSRHQNQELNPLPMITATCLEPLLKRDGWYAQKDSKQSGGAHWNMDQSAG